MTLVCSRVEGSEFDYVGLLRAVEAGDTGEEESEVVISALHLFDSDAEDSTDSDSDSCTISNERTRKLK